MPTKKTESGKSYKVDAKKFTWSPSQEADEDLPDVVLPLRIKLKTVIKMSAVVLDAPGMHELLSEIVPEQAETFGEMDLNDFQAMFNAWNSEYELLSGASLGESEGSSN